MSATVIFYQSFGIFYSFISLGTISYHFKQHVIYLTRHLSSFLFFQKRKKGQEAL